MKKTLLFTAITAFLWVPQKTTAQNLQSIAIQSGFNADVIANGVGTSASSTNNDVDGVSFAFVSRDFQLTAASPALTYGLPVDGLITSAVSAPAGLNYQLAPYSGNNALRLESLNDSGTLVFTTPIPAVSLYMLATGGSGDCIVNVTVNFADATTETVNGLAISDWYDGTNYAIQGLGRINIANDVLETGGGTNPRLYQIPIAISGANQSKLIQSVTITKAATGGIPDIFAFSADAYTSCPGPSNITFTSTTDGGIFNWTAPASAPSLGYQYYYASANIPPTASTTPSGTVGAGVTSVQLSGLAMGATYYFWVRSDCGGQQGFWQMKTFTTGQMETTYTIGDINTEYTTGVTTASTTACPGTLTINVPAGFQIAATAVSYTMTTALNGWMSEQRSLLVCTNNNATEAAVTSGVGGTTGTYAYNRTGLTLANGLSGNITFDLRAWRAYGGSGCNTDYNRVDNNTWKITVTLTQALSTVDHAAPKIKFYPIPFTDILHLDNAQQVKTIVVTDATGKLVRTINEPQQDMYLGDLNSGLYILTMTMQEGYTQHAKIIKQ